MLNLAVTNKNSTILSRFCLITICAFLLMATLSYLGFSLSHWSFDQTSSDILASPSWQHPFGCDELGRDLFARIVFGARLSITIGVVTAILSMLIGTTYGAISGYVGGKVDTIMMRIIDIAYSLPDLLLMILLGAIVGRGTVGILLALGLVSWRGTARIVRAQFLQLKTEEYVEAARAIGSSHLDIILRHLLPNALGPLIVAITFTVPQAILAESTLSFIGLGLAAPACSWGTLASDGWKLIRGYPHLLIAPSICICLTVFAFNHLGDRLQDKLNPKIR